MNGLPARSSGEAMSSPSISKAPRWRLLFLILTLPFISNGAMAGERPAASAVATAHPLATEAGIGILEQGGNAFDAAVTVSAVLAVVEPYSSGIGGGGFWLLHRASDGQNIMLDGRETAPLAADADMYLDASGEPVERSSIDGPLAAGIPGEPAALVHLAHHYGRLTLAETLAPAIRIARQGFAVDRQYLKMAKWRLPVLQRYPASAKVFLVDDDIPSAGYVLKQPDLAETLEQLARNGHAGFYQGVIATRLVEAVRAAGGIWTHEDLAGYSVKERKPVSGSFFGQRVTSSAPPSSGGVVLLEMLNMLEALPRGEEEAIHDPHLLIEVMRRAYKDRALYLGDPDFVDVPVDRLLDKQYAQSLARTIESGRASVSEPVIDLEPDGPHTTHFSILDQEGNRVAATLSINYPFGSGFVAEGTGVLLNDEMDDFVMKPGVPNVYGLVGNKANSIAPGKRMLSSMTPTFIEDEQGVAILGTPGGSRIISMLLLAIIEQTRDKSPVWWVDLPRFHHQYLPDLVQYEDGAFSEDAITRLTALGHKLEKLSGTYGDMQAIYWNRQTGEVDAASDTRGIGLSIVRDVRPAEVAIDQ